LALDRRQETHLDSPRDEDGVKERESERIQWRDIKSLGKWKWAADRLTVHSDRFSGSHPTASLVFSTVYRGVEVISRHGKLRIATE
jgi:hypothetical protein